MDYEFKGSINLRLDSTAHKFLDAHELGPDVLDFEPDADRVREALINEMLSWLTDLGITVEVELDEARINL